MPLVEYSFCLTSGSRPSLMQHIQTVLGSRPNVEIEAIRFEEPELFEMQQGRLVRHWPTWWEITLYTWQPLSAEVAADLERQLMSVGEIMAKKKTVAEIPKGNSFLPVQVPAQVPVPVKPSGFAAIEDWPLYFKLTPVIHVQSNETTA